jgi:outer membrane receptor protein involved in Fe transport
VTPRIAALVKLTDHLTFRASRGVANKMPSAQQLYGTTAVDASIAVNAGLKLQGKDPLPDGAKLIAYHQTPAKKLDPEKIASTEFGLRYYLSGDMYMEFVAYTNRIRNPLVRDWCALDSTLPNAYVRQGVATEYNDTRTYITQSAAEVKLQGYQLITVLKDLVKPMHLNFKGALTISGGGEEILDSEAGVDDVQHISYIRQVPKYMFQWSVDFDFLKILHFSLENVYCSKWARRYYRGNDNKFLWTTPYYNLDLIFTVKMGKHLAGSVKVNNVFNTQYGGIDVKDMDVDLPYNPQLLRQLRFVLTYEFK